MVTEQITVTDEGVRKLLQKACADPESFVRGGPTLTPFFFSLMRGGRIQIPLLVGHQWPASETPYKWRFTGGADDDPTLNARLVAL